MAKIIGNTTATPNPRPDWSQTDSAKADYIKNKPELANVATTGSYSDLKDTPVITNEIDDNGVVYLNNTNNGTGGGSDSSQFVTKDYVDSLFSSYITDIDTIVGGES